LKHVHSYTGTYLYSFASSVPVITRLYLKSSQSQDVSPVTVYSSQMTTALRTLLTEDSSFWC